MSATCLVVMYHYVRDTAITPFPEIRALHPGDFERQLDWLQAHRVLVTPEAFEAAVTGHGVLPPDPALLTFDDGFADHHDTVLPILAARGLSGLFFIAADATGPSARVLPVHKTHFLLAYLGAEAFGRAVLDECAALRISDDGRRPFGDDRWEHTDERAIKDVLNYELPFDVASRLLSDLFARHLGDEHAFARDLYLDEAEVSAMARAGQVFGYHTRGHRMLSRLSVDEQRMELSGGVEWIRQLTGQARVSFCYPWGGLGAYTRDTVSLLAAGGYSTAFNTVRRRVVVGRDGRFELPRIDARDLPPCSEGEPVGELPDDAVVRERTAP